MAELSGMGLSPDILHRLLLTEDDGSPSPESKGRVPLATASTTTAGHGKVENNDEVLEFEFESDEASPPMEGTSPRTRASKIKEVMLDPILDEYDDDQHNRNGFLSTSPEAGPSSLPTGSGLHPHHRKFRIRLLSNGQPVQSTNGGSPKPMSVMDVMAAQNQAESWRSEQTLGSGRRPSRLKRARVNSHGGAKAQYVLTGESPDVSHRCVSLIRARGS